MTRKDLKHWNHILELSLRETAFLIAGIDPNSEKTGADKRRHSLAYQRAIFEAVARADQFAWEFARNLARLLLDSEKNAKKIEEMTRTSDIWEASGARLDNLPTREIRQSVSAVLRDPENVPILIPTDPWYTATVSGVDLRMWIERAGIESAYRFVDEQTIVVKPRAVCRDESEARAKNLAYRSALIEDLSNDLKQSEASDGPLSLRHQNSSVTLSKVEIDPSDLPLELDAANMALRAVTNGYGDPSATKRNRLVEYLRQHYPDFKLEQVQRIATVANPDKSTGRKNSGRE